MSITQAKRARMKAGTQPKAKAPTSIAASQVDQPKSNLRTPIPDLNTVDLVFGNIRHMPRYDAVPAEFKRSRGNQYTEFISGWFFSGLKPEDLARLQPRDGVDKTIALRAISAILKSFEPKHEHKEAGAAYLLSEWFTLAPKAA